jgi:hypothetical protein
LPVARRKGHPQRALAWQTLPIRPPQFAAIFPMRNSNSSRKKINTTNNPAPNLIPLNIKARPVGPSSPHPTHRHGSPAAPFTDTCDQPPTTCCTTQLSGIMENTFLAHPLRCRGNTRQFLCSGLNHTSRHLGGGPARRTQEEDDTFKDPDEANGWKSFERCNSHCKMS